jgi:cell wall assembly regulator SMI1
VVELAPAAPPEELERLEGELGLPLPRELRATLELTTGIDGGALESIDFTGRTLDVEVRELFPAGLPVAADGYGNFWVLDLTPDEPETAPVFFLCHDAPVVLYQAPSLGQFLHETFRMSIPPHASLVDDVHDDRLFHVWRENPGATARSAALAADDDLRAFAEQLDDRFEVVDLRSPEIGMGFSWGRYGPRTEVRRHGFLRLFAYAPPERKPGLLRRVFG